MRAVDTSDRDTSVEMLRREMRRVKRMLDRDCIFFWRLFQDIFQQKTVNFTGLILAPNASEEVAREAGLILTPNVSDEAGRQEDGRGLLCGVCSGSSSILTVVIKVS